MALSLLCVFSVAASSPEPAEAARTNTIALEDVPPKIAREFRAAWIATYSNIDWPSKPGLPVQRQQDELRALIAQAADLGLNALIFQVRPACDAFYRSDLEPWSSYLTGTMGQAPEGGFDPLQYAIEQAHARGLELHAWFNPYRAGLAGTKTSSRHISKTQPRLVRRYGNYLWLDPTERAVQDYTARVILDVVKRYDIDGVHMDDYFYPYPEKDRGGAIVEFPDDSGWAAYRKRGGKLARGDWRRDSVNTLVRRLKTEIHAAKSWVTFGISPFGIWRPGFPEQIKGLDAYERLFADARTWLVNGWVDYLAPQLYWSIDRPETSYSALFGWWRDQDARGIPIWPGGAVTRVNNPESNWPAQEILRQIDLSRTAAQPGYIHWNLSALIASPAALRDGLRRNVYGQPALVPANRGDTGDVPKPEFDAARDSAGQLRLSWTVPASQRVAFWILQTRAGDSWTTRLLPAAQRELVLPKTDLGAAAISYLSRHRNVSPVALRSF